MFKRNRYTTLTETLALLEDRLSECNPDVDKNQVEFLRREIDETRTEILKIEIKSIKENSMFKQIKIPNVLYEMAQDIERKKKRKIEKIFEEYIKEEWKKL